MDFYANDSLGQWTPNHKPPGKYLRSILQNLMKVFSSNPFIRDFTDIDMLDTHESRYAFTLLARCFKGPYIYIFIHFNSFVQWSNLFSFQNVEIVGVVSLISLTVKRNKTIIFTKISL